MCQPLVQKPAADVQMEVPGAHGVFIVHALNHAMAVISSDLGNVTMPLQFRVEVLVQDLQWKRRFATNLYRVQLVPR